MTNIISKSLFIRGCQCHKSLYLHKFHDELRDTLSEAQEAIFSTGTSVGEVARDLYPGGTNIRELTAGDTAKALTETANHMASGARVIYEAAFSCDNLLAYVDILVRDGESWKIFEVKASTSVSDTYLLDCAFQYHLLTLCGIQVSDVSVVHLNNKYIRQGALELKELFKTVSVLEEVKTLRSVVIENLEQQFAILNADSIPAIDIGLQCHSPYPCDFMGHCWKHVPEYSVFEVAGLSANKKMALYSSGILEIKDIPEGYKLNKNQKIQVDGVKHNRSHFDKAMVKEFLNTLKYPIYFMDFETMMPAIPLFDKSTPYQQIPFQYSLHYLPHRGAELQHMEFLAEAIEGKDPREAFIKVAGGYPKTRNGARL